MTRTVQRRARRKPQSGGKAKPAEQPWREARPEEVARARKLLADPSYPPKNITDAVARLLARHLRPGR